MKEFLTTREDYHLLHPRQVIILVVGSFERANMMPLGWHTILSRNPFLVGLAISPKRFSHSMLMDFPFATINLVDKSFEELVENTGKCSGKNVDKFEQFHVNKVLAENGSAYIEAYQLTWKQLEKVILKQVITPSLCWKLQNPC